MSRILLFDSGCSTCSDLASGVARECGDLLTVGRLRDPEMQMLLHQSRPGWAWEPTLIEVEADSVRVFTGFALRVRLLTVLGPQRAWRLATFIARSQAPIVPTDESRRGPIKRGATFAAGAAGVALLGPPPTRVNAQIEADGIQRPGRFSRGEGIDDWKVDRTANGFLVRFEHQNRARSGVLRVTYSSGGDGVSYLLRRDGEQLEMAINKRRGTFAGVDANGNSTAGTFDWDRQRWIVAARDERVLEDSAKDFRIGFAIASDLEGRSGQRSQTLESNTVEAAGPCPCTTQYRQRGQALGTARSLACEAAVLDANQQCTNGFCFGCCRLVGDDCDCLCIPGLGDYGCGCGRSGDPCSGQCAQG